MMTLMEEVEYIMGEENVVEHRQIDMEKEYYEQNIEELENRMKEKGIIVYRKSKYKRAKPSFYDWCLKNKVNDKICLLVYEENYAVREGQDYNLKEFMKAEFIFFYVINYDDYCLFFILNNGMIVYNDNRNYYELYNGFLDFRSKYITDKIKYTNNVLCNYLISLNEKQKQNKSIVKEMMELFTNMIKEYNVF